MRRFTLASAAAAVALTIAIPMGAHADERIVPSDTSDHIEAMRLECGVRQADAGPVVGCKWSAPTSPRAAGIRLYRLDPTTDPYRQVIFRTRDLEVTHYTDAEVRRGHRYAYAVQALSADGAVVGQSRTQWVEVPADHDVEVLRLHCKLGPAREAIGCEWSAPQSRDAYVVTLWRTVNDGPREVVERFRPSGPNAYRDPVPRGATEVTYAVIATSESDRIVARSRAETVRIPTIDVRPIDPKPTDRKPVDVVPVDTAPSDVAPNDVAPSDVAPSDAPTDAAPVALAADRPVFRWTAALQARILRLIRELAAL